MNEFNGGGICIFNRLFKIPDAWIRQHANMEEDFDLDG